MRHVENGLISQMYECASKLAQKNCRASEVTMFDSLESYTEDYTSFDDLVLQNFKHIFIYYFLLCSLVFVAFTVHHLAKFVRMNWILIRSRFEPVIHVGALWLAWLRRPSNQIEGQAE